MGDFTWLWLNEAAQLIASRLPKIDPNNSSNPKTVLNEARRQLLARAHVGSLEVQGKPCNPELEESLPLGDWKVVHSSFWDPDHRPGTGALSDINLTLIWENNCVSYEDEEGCCWGYADLRVREKDIDRLWRSHANAVADENSYGQSSSSPKNAASKNAGGAPRLFRDDLLVEMIRIADLDGLPDRAEIRGRLRDLSLPLPHWDNGGPSDSTIYEIVRMVYDKLQKP